MRGFIDDTETTGLTHVADIDGDVWNAFGVYAQPAFAIIDDNGEIETFMGGLGADDLADSIDELLAPAGLTFMRSDETNGVVRTIG